MKGLSAVFAFASCLRNTRDASTAISIQGGSIMLHWAAIFLIIGLVAAFLGVSGVAGTATYIAYALFVIFVVVAIISFVMGKRPPA